ncbi:MAG: hypothetical protein AB7D57_13850, partial [Desulfovibrionaceae bacterium]
MKKRLGNVLLVLLPLAFLMAGRPWLLYSQESPNFVEQRWATGADLTPGPAFSQAAAQLADPAGSASPQAAPAAPAAPEPARWDADAPLPAPPVPAPDAAPPAAHHQPKSPAAYADADKWTFTADRVAAQHDSQYIEAEGNATF